MEIDLIQATEWGYPKAPQYSEWGYTSYEYWLKKSLERILSNPRRKAEIRINENGEIAIFAD